MLHVSMVRLVLILLSFCLISGEVVDFSEKVQLLELKKAILDHHNMLSSWTITNPNHCSWFGVTCDSHGRVSELRIPGGNFAHSGSCLSNNYTELSLHGFGIDRDCSLLKKGRFLSGKLSDAIGKLSELRVLSLPFNHIRGELPSGVWGLKNLEVVDIEGNSMTANLSMISFTNLKNLQVLNLGYNRVFGEIPNSLSECKDLSILNLAGNRIGGSVPNFLGNFVKLKVINLSKNRIIGSLRDDFWSKCDALEHVDFSGNFLNGMIPRSSGICSSLRTMLLFSNRFSGVLPVEIGNLKVLEVLDVSRNSLKGVIPTSIGNCVKLSIIVLSSDFSDHNKDGNLFASSIPLQITMLPNLKLIWAPNMNLDGEFPRNWGDCRTLRMVNLAGNHLKGEISSVFENCPNLHFLNVSSNMIEGVLDEKLPVRCMTVFDISRNLMFGTIPEFKISPCYQSNFSQQLDQVAVYLSYFAHKSRVKLRLSLSHFTPAMIHDFSDNNFTGSIPLLPMISSIRAHEKRATKIDYAFLAGGNKLSRGLFYDNLSRNCNDLNGFVLNVSNNIICGKLPSNVGANWACLKFLDASNNQISGFVPKSLVNLRNLTVLLLDHNRLSGEIPSGLLKLKSRMKFDFSFNNLSGSITMDHNAINCKYFVGNPLLHRCQFATLSSVAPQEPWAVGFESLNNTGSTDSDGRKKGMNSFELVLIIVPSIIVIVLVALIILYLYRRKQKPNLAVASRSVSPRLPPPPSSSSSRRVQQESLVVFKEIGVRLTLDTVVQATGNFTSRNCIGSGGFGSTYRAEISPGITVAVKRLTVEMCQGVPQFNAEIRSLGRIRHPNLVTLIGYYASMSEMFLIYNYLPGGNLENFILEKRSRVFGLKVLHKIALDVGNALYFLHDQCHPRILHRDVKPSNILLDENLNAYLSDFGLARLLDDFETHVTTGVAGTFGYVAPEYALTCRASEKSDVYSYGVMLLELLSDKRALDSSFSSQENGYTIVTWAVMLRREGRPEEVFSTGLWEAGTEDVLLELLHLGLLCTTDSITSRPTMRQVVQKLKQIQPALIDC